MKWNPGYPNERLPRLRSRYIRLHAALDLRASRLVDFVEDEFQRLQAAKSTHSLSTGNRLRNLSISDEADYAVIARIVPAYGRDEQALSCQGRKSASLFDGSPV